MVNFTEEAVKKIRDNDRDKYKHLLALTKKMYRGDIKIGDVVERYTDFGYRGKRSWEKGIVIYIHPKHNFHCVEFTFANGNKIRECFKGTARLQSSTMEVV